MWFAKADVKHFKGVALRTFTNIQEYDELKKKKNSVTGMYFKDFVHRYRTAF